MAALIVILKIIACILMGIRLYLYYQIKKQDKTVLFRFELMSLIEHAAGYGVFLVAVFSAINKDSYFFTLGLNFVNVLIVLSHNFRIVIAGDSKILVNLKIYDKKSIRGINATTFTLHVFPRHGNEIKVLIPLTHNEAFKNLKYVKY